MRLPIVLALALPARAQEAVPIDSYQDPDARERVRLALPRRAAVDTRITRCQVGARERASVRPGAMGFNRLIFRRETAARIDWTADAVPVEMIGASLLDNPLRRDAARGIRGVGTRLYPRIGGGL